MGPRKCIVYSSVHFPSRNSAIIRRAVSNLPFARVKGELLRRILAEWKKALRRENGERFGLKVTFAVLYARRDR